MNKTNISCCDYTWNPVSGCSPVSEACEHCYARRLAETRLRGRCGYPLLDPFAVTLHPERLDEPCRVAKPSRIFPVSMGDLMHPDVPTDFIHSVFNVMNICSHHQFYVLTKRPDRLLEVIKPDPPVWYGLYCPLPNVWLGVTVESQAHVGRLDHLRTLAERGWRIFVSAEPLLSALDLAPYLQWGTVTEPVLGIEWVICGGETGLGARPMHPDWVRSLRDQCMAACVPFFFKSWGDWLPDDQVDRNNRLQWPGFTKARFGALGADGSWTPGMWVSTLGMCMYRLGKKAASHLLDGTEWRQTP